MTEFDWHRSVDTSAMLKVVRSRGSDRLWRLYALACLRQLGSHLPSDRSHRGLDVAELFADGRASSDALRYAWESASEAATHAALAAYEDEVRAQFRWDEIYAGFVDAARPARLMLPALQESFAIEELDPGLRDPYLLREVFGNPFIWREADPLWQTWNDGEVVNLATSIYQERAWDRLPILADALEDAGCDDAAILEHLRSPGPHVRGCWALDLILGRS